jgi:hypothetical protein
LFLFFEMFLETDLFDAFVILDHKWVPGSMIGGMCAGEVIVAKQAAVKLLCGSAFSIFAWSAAAV